MAIGPDSNIAVWVVTPNGLALARQLQRRWPTATMHISHRLSTSAHGVEALPFTRLIDAVAEQFHRFDGHVFIMATGIVVRSIATHLRGKTVDPAVVVVDDRGGFAVSLLSGHIGGANRLAKEVARVLGAVPVITTATDVNDKPAIDLVASDAGLSIENPECIKIVNRALLAGEPVRVHDPAGWIKDRLPDIRPFYPEKIAEAGAAVWVDDAVCVLSPDILVLRPPSLVAGIGCNRNTPKGEIHTFLQESLFRFGLSIKSLCGIASIDLKSDEAGLVALASEMRVPLEFFSKEALGRVEGVTTPSATVKKHVGVPSVCEAAAILASRNGRLIVPKQISKNVTVAVARRIFPWSASVREPPTTCPGGPSMS